MLLASLGVLREVYPPGDALGSVRQLADLAGAVALAQSYEPFGELLTSAETRTSNFQFSGQQVDGTGLVYLRARYMEPVVGRFLSRDVWEGDPNQPMSCNGWLYASANPTNLTDPSGMYWTDPQCESLPNFEARELCRINRVGNWPSRFDEPPYVNWFPARGLRLLPDFDMPRNTIGAQLGFRAAGQVWSNECGQLSLAAIIGLTARTAVERFHSWATSHIPGWTGDRETWGTWLRDFVNMEYSRLWEASVASVRHHVPSTAAWIRNQLVDSYVVPLVNIQAGFADPVQGGRVGVGGIDPTPHWVVITGVSAEWRPNEGSPYNWVRIFNPFSNGTEYYRWLIEEGRGRRGGFVEAWRQQTASLTSVVLRRKGIGEVPLPRRMEEAE